MATVMQSAPLSPPSVDPPSPSVRKNVLLVDLENVANPELGRLAGMDVEVYLFLNAKATHIRTELVVPAKNGGTAPQLIQTGGVGKNALDFHIAFYLGELTSKHNGSCYHIISKDGGFDPLVTHLKSRGIAIGRCAAIADLPFLPRVRGSGPAKVHKAPVQPAPIAQKRKPTTPSEIADIYAQRLMSPAFPRPKTPEALFNALKHSYNLGLNELEFSAIFTLLQEDGHIQLVDGQLTYDVSCRPAQPSS